MRQLSLLLLSVLTLSAAELPRVSPESVDMSSAKLRQIDNQVLELIGQNKLAGGTVAITRKGKLVHFRSYGHADLENDRPWNDDTILRIYSMTKAITSTAVMMMHEEGKFALDDPVAKHLPEFKDVKVFNEGKLTPPRRAMTIRDLLRHTSGLTYGIFGNSDVDKAYREADLLNNDHTLTDMSAKLAKLPLAAHPGTEFIYSVSTDLLGRLVEVWSGQPFDKFLKQRIFNPLDMKDTGFHVPKKKRDRFANVYRPAKGGMKVQETVAGSRFLKRPKFSSGGGGLVSTTRDYLHFIQMIANGGSLFGQRLLKKETVALMTRNHVPAEAMPIGVGSKRPGVGFGLGFSVRTKMSQWDPQGRVREFGWGGMASTHYWASPEDELVVVTMEQTLPYSFLLEFALKGHIYGALLD